MSAPGKPQQTNAPGRLRAGTAAWIGAVAPLALGFGLAVFLAGSAPVERLRNIVFDQYLRAAPRA